MRGSWLEQLHGKAISHQLPAKLQLSSHILFSLSPPSVSNFNHIAVSFVMCSVPG